MIDRCRTNLNNNVKSVRVIALDLFELRLGVGPGKRNIDVGTVELLSQIHFQALRGSNDDVRGAIVAEELSKTETSGPSTEHEHGRANLRGNLLQTVSSARSGLEKGSINIAEVVNLEHFPSGVCAVLGETTIHF